MFNKNGPELRGVEQKSWDLKSIRIRCPAMQLKSTNLATLANVRDSLCMNNMMLFDIALKEDQREIYKHRRLCASLQHFSEESLCS